MRRRALLQSGMVLGAMGQVPGCAKAAKPHVLAAASDRQQNYWLTGMDADWQLMFKVPIPFRGHEIVYHPFAPKVVLIARRPATWLYGFDLADPHQGRLIQSKQGYHFHGHGVFDPSGQWLYTAENDYVRGRGVIVVRDAHTLNPIRYVDSGGIGPHEMKLLPDGTMAIANGGLLTHPSQPRKKLNRDNFESNIAFLDLADDRILDRIPAPFSQVSMRHLDIADEKIVVGFQDEGPSTRLIPLVGVIGKDRRFSIPEIDATALRRMKAYTASVGVSPSGDVAVITSPRGHTVSVWDLNQLEHAGSFRLRDTAAVDWSTRTNGFVISGGGGDVFSISLDRLSKCETPPSDKRVHRSLAGLMWDNHLKVV
ncbi:MAG: DUF1513 domain-containing protein [Pseudomonadota bacterium]